MWKRDLNITSCICFNVWSKYNFRWVNIQGGSKKSKLLTQYNSLLFFEPPCILGCHFSPKLLWLVFCDKKVKEVVFFYLYTFKTLSRSENTMGPLHTLNQMVNQMVNHLLSC